MSHCPQTCETPLSGRSGQQLRHGPSEDEQPRTKADELLRAIFLSMKHTSGLLDKKLTDKTKLKLDREVGGGDLFLNCGIELLAYRYVTYQISYPYDGPINFETCIKM